MTRQLTVASPGLEKKGERTMHREWDWSKHLEITGITVR